MISKELLSEVLDVVCTDVIDDFYGSMQCFKTDNKEFNHLISIYELANKCKEWAHSRGYTIFSAFNYHCYLYSNDDILQYPNKFRVLDDFAIGTKSEPEAVVKACQWILDNKGKR